MNPRIPLTRPNVDEATIAGVGDVLRSGWLTSGPQVKALEAALSEFFGGRPVRVFNSGTCTMEIALRIAGIGPGDEVITTPLSWVATSNVILEVGARPVFVDIDATTRNIDLQRIEGALTKKSRAIIPVDLAGLPVDRTRLYAIANKHSLRVVEDAAQSIGAEWRGKRIGSFGDFVSFSFHPNKNITTIEGGCLVVNNEAEAKLAEQYRLQGVVRSGYDGMEVEVMGGKFNLTDVAARVGLGQLPYLEQFTRQRRELARHYFKCFSGRAEALGLQLPPQDFDNCNWHMYQVVLPESRLKVKRAQVMAELDSAGIGTGVHYPAIHLFALYRKQGWQEGDFPIAEQVCRNILSLPMFAQLTFADVERVVDTLLTILNNHKQ